MIRSLGIYCFNDPKWTAVVVISSMLSNYSGHIKHTLRLVLQLAGRYLVRGSDHRSTSASLDHTSHPGHKLEGEGGGGGGVQTTVLLPQS